jgi:hypothetical protein
MAAPDATTSTAVVGFPARGEAMLVQWTNPSTGDDADYVEVQVSTNEGVDWDDAGAVDGTAESFTYWRTSSDPATFRTRRVNVDGSSSWDTMLVEATPPAVVELDSSRTRIIFLVGEYWAGFAPSNALANFRSNYQYWTRRISRLYDPTPDLTAFVWNHVGLSMPISSVTPNSPVAGDTRITLAISHGRDVGAVFRVDFRSTGLSDLDTPDGFDVEVISATQLAIRGFVASGSASVGLCDIPSVDTYNGDVNSNTDRTASGSYPATTWGPDYSLMRDVQDRVNEASGGEDVIVLVKVTGGFPLRGRTADTGRRWLKQFDSDAVSATGVYLSGWREVSVTLRDVAQWLSEFRSGSIITVEAIGVSIGLNDGILGTAATTKRTLAVQSITVAGDTATITTSSAHGLSAPASGKSRLAGRVTGITTDTLSIEGKILELSVASTTSFTLTEVDATGLSDPTVTAGATQIQVADPGYFYDEDLEQFVSDLRDEVEDNFGVAPADQLLVINRPDPVTVSYLDLSIQNVIDRAPTSISNARVVDLVDLDRLDNTAPSLTPTVTGSVVITASNQTLVKASGGLSVFTPGDIISFLTGTNAGKIMLASTVSDTTIGFTPYAGAPALLVDETASITIGRIFFGVSDFFYSADGLLRHGEMVAAAIAREAPTAAVAAKTPAVMVMCIGDSYVEGVSYLQFSLDDDPRLISTVADPIQGLKVWRPDSQAWEDYWLDSTGSNVNRHPEWNATKNVPGGQTLSVQPSLLVGLRERYPDETVWLVNLGKSGSTLATVPIDTEELQYPLAAAALTTDGVILQLANGVKVSSDRSFPVLLAGVSGLSADINGLRSATPVAFDAGSGGTSFFQIDSVGITGTPSVVGATAGIRPPAWEQGADELFASIQTEFQAAIQAAWDAGYVPDFRGIYVMLGLNDAALGVETEFANELAAFVDSMRSMVRTQGQPREFDVPVVWLNPIEHDDMAAGTAAALPTIRTALADQAQSDPYFTVLSLDEDEDWLENPAVISRDTIHPTFRGYVEIGYRLARSGLDQIAGFTARHPVDFTPQVPTGGVSP